MIDSSKKLLVVDDDQDVKYIVDYILKRAGYEIVNAYNGREAIEEYKKHSPDLVLMDIRMPVMNGDEAMKVIREHDPEAKMVVLTAYNHTQNELGVPVLRKGFRSDELLQLVKNNLPNN